MNPLDIITKSFSSAFDSIINAEIYFRSNRLTLLQAGLIVLLPQISAYLLEYNKQFGLNFQVKLESYPLLLFVFFASAVYVLTEPRISVKKSSDVFKLAFLSIHIFAFALGANLLYAVTIQLLQIDDVVLNEIRMISTHRTTDLKPPVFSLWYSTPFILVSVTAVFANSLRRHRIRMRVILRSAFFWRTFVVTLMLALYQYMAFIEFAAAYHVVPG